MTKEMIEAQRRREKDLKDVAATTKEMSSMSDSEKQRIIVQISAVQTELHSALDSRYGLLYARSFPMKVTLFTTTDCCIQGQFL